MNSSAEEGLAPAVPAGPLGHDSADLIDYYEAVQGVPRIREGLNPATWCAPCQPSCILSCLRCLPVRSLWSASTAGLPSLLATATGGLTLT